MKKMFILSMLVLGLVISPLYTATSEAAYSSSVYNSQKIMSKFAIPTGPIDGNLGPQTRRGLCIFRYMSGLSVSLKTLDSTTYSKLKSYNTTYSSLSTIPARMSTSTNQILVAHETCQAMTFSKKAANGKHYYAKVMAISTGVTGHGTPNGTYSLNKTKLGWSCSTTYNTTCKTQTTGKYLSHGSYGNMYNYRWFNSSKYGIHGSTSVPTYPASHGCVRVTVSDSDWMYANVGNGSIVPKLVVTGAYVGY